MDFRIQTHDLNQLVYFCPHSDGHYLHIEASRASLGNNASLISAMCSDTGPQCLKFWYLLYGSADKMGLDVYLYQDKRARLLWKTRNDQGNVWHLAQVDLVINGTFQVSRVDLNTARNLL